MEFEGEFETHITIKPDGASVDSAEEWADRHGFKFHHIMLARGGQTSQPMVTFRGQGHLASEVEAANRVSTDLSTAGFPVVRVKVEAAVSNCDIPITDQDGASHAERYFEHHIKLLLDRNSDQQELVKLAIRHAAHLSRNARRIREDGREERFITQRCYRAGLETAGNRLKVLLDNLNQSEFTIVSVEQEYVVYDSAPCVDAGWLDSGGK